MEIKYRIVETLKGIFHIEYKYNDEFSSWISAGTENSYDKAFRLIEKRKNEFGDSDVKIHYL